MAEDTTATATEEQTQGTQTTETESSWLDSLPDDLKGADSLKDIPDVSTLAKNYVNTKALVGANTVKLPSRTAEPAEWDKFYASVGRPETPDKYQLPDKGLPEGFKLSDDDQKAFRSFVHKTGMNELQAATAYREYANMVDAAQKARAEKATDEAKAHVEAIKKEYGQAFAERLALNKRLIGQFDKEGEFSKFLDESGLGNHPSVFRFLERIASQMDSDVILGAGPDQQRSNAPAEARAKIDLYQAEHHVALSDVHHAEHAVRSRELQKLFEQAYPDETPNAG